MSSPYNNNDKKPPPSSSSQAPPPTRVAIENVDFILEEQKRKDLQEKVDRHKNKSRRQRHRRNESFGKNPSISEGANANDLGNSDWLLALNNSAAGAEGSAMNISRQSLTYQQDETTPSTSEQQRLLQVHQQIQQGYKSYLVPIQGSTDPDLTQQQQEQPYASWPVGAPLEGQVHPLTGDPNGPQQQQQQQANNYQLEANNYQQQQQQQQQDNTNYQQQQEIDDEYASLLHQKFSSTSGYGATSTSPTTANTSAVTARLPAPGGPPPSGRRSRTNSREYSPRFQNHKQASLPTYPHAPLQPLSDAYSRNFIAGPPPPPPTQSAFGNRTTTPQTPPHIHRRSHSDNYSNRYPFPPQQQQPYYQQQQQQHLPYFQQQQQQQQQQHPLLRKNDKPPKLASNSPRLGGASTSPRFPSAVALRKSFPSSSVPPGHRRVQSGSGRMMGRRNSNPQNMMAGNATLSPSMSFSNLLPEGAMGTIAGAAGSSGNSLGGGGGATMPSPRQHRRSSSLASSSGMSVQSEASYMSVVSDIRKSSFYGGYDEATGEAQLHYPRENVHLSSSKQLHTGWIYALPVDVEAFEEYHRQAEEAMMWEDEELDHNLHRCGCQCPACYHGCTGHTANNRKSRQTNDPFQKLPQTTFALAIDDNIYKNVLDEINQAATMPCGLFYCGHHEDVDHPSIFIALVIVVALFIAMGYVAYFADEVIG